MCVYLSHPHTLSPGLSPSLTKGYGGFSELFVCFKGRGPEGPKGPPSEGGRDSNEKDVR